MDLRTLRTFHMIVQHGSFSRAAQEMNYVQSTVTMQIQKLESELGVQLFKREKEITLTEAGRLFYDQSLQIVKNMEQIKDSLADLKSGEAGHIRLGVTEPSASCRLPDILGAFISMYPKIRISIEISNTAHLCERVLAGELDFALCTAPALGSGLYFEPLFEEEFAVLLPGNHPLALQDVIYPEDLQKARLLITSQTCPYRRKLEMLLQAKGAAALDTMEIGSMSALKYYVRSGLGIALVPAITVEPGWAGTTARTISGSLVGMPVGIVCKESAYPFQLATRKLYHHLRQALASPPETSMNDHPG